jgi:hypothetical protein
VGEGHPEIRIRLYAIERHFAEHLGGRRGASWA